LTEIRLRIATYESHSEFSFSGLGKNIEISSDLNYEKVSHIVRLYYGEYSDEVMPYFESVESKIHARTFKHHIAMWPMFLQTLGEYVFQNLLPPEIIKAVQRIPIDSVLFLELNSGSALIPWEHMYTGDNFLCLSHKIGRIGEEKQLVKPPQNVSRFIPMLIVADPTGDLPATQRETNYIINQLRGSNIRITRYGSEIRKNQYYNLLKSGKFDLIHYSGHSASSMEPGKSYHHFLDGPLFGDEIESLSSYKMPKLVFCNSCQSGESSISNELTGNTSLASSYLKAGAESSIGTIWTVSDSGSADISSDIYRYLLFGSTIGEALLMAKRNSFRRWGYHDPVWLSFILFGDPRMKLSSNK
jgi:CHAT domain-containing protein